jgi:hypothetical protein
VREHEAHTPFILRVPGAGSGRSDVFVQPQDVFATVLGLTGGELPEGVDSNDVLALAKAGKSGPREFAVAGRAVSPEWGTAGKTGLFTVFAAEHYAEIALKPEHDRLVRYGTFEDVAPDHAALVSRLRKAGIAELKRRGADPKVIAWLRAEGKKRFPEDARPFDGWPAPAGYYAYFNRLCKD